MVVFYFLECVIFNVTAACMMNFIASCAIVVAIEGVAIAILPIISLLHYCSAAKKASNQTFMQKEIFISSLECSCMAVADLYC